MFTKPSIATFVFTFVILSIVIPSASAGPFYALCVAGCTGFCTAGAPPAIALCMTACIAGCGPSCFSTDSSVTRSISDSSFEVIPITQCNPGDVIKSFDSFDAHEWTTVKQVDIVPGNFTFIQFTLNSDEIIEVTPNHGMFIVRENTPIVVPAEDVKITDSLFSGSKHSIQGKPISSIQTINKNTYVRLTTDSGAVFTNGISTSTICDEEVSYSKGAPVFDVLSSWRSRHPHLV